MMLGRNIVATFMMKLFKARSVNLKVFLFSYNLVVLSTYGFDRVNGFDLQESDARSHINFGQSHFQTLTP